MVKQSWSSSILGEIIGHRIQIGSNNRVHVLGMVRQYCPEFSPLGQYFPGIRPVEQDCPGIRPVGQYFPSIRPVGQYCPSIRPVGQYFLGIRLVGQCCPCIRHGGKILSRY